MAYRVLADLVVATHLVFMLYALFGGLLRLWKTWSVFVHAPTAIWIAVVAFRGWICPLTPLENTLRFAAGEAGYEGSFVEHYPHPSDLSIGAHSRQPVPHRRRGGRGEHRGLRLRLLPPEAETFGAERPLKGRCVTPSASVTEAPDPIYEIFMEHPHDAAGLFMTRANCCSHLFRTRANFGA